MAQLGDIQMTMDGPPAAHLEVVHTQFVLGLLETALDRPVSKGRRQQVGEGHTGRGVADEILDLARLHVASHNQRLRSIGRTRGSRRGHHQVHSRHLDLPHDRPPGGILRDSSRRRSTGTPRYAEASWIAASSGRPFSPTRYFKNWRADFSWRSTFRWGSTKSATYPRRLACTRDLFVSTALSASIVTSIAARAFTASVPQTKSSSTLP